ncbi:ATP-binding protein [Agarivorans sp. TSD2052]|uniref:ATP-binding protein n=1 Tax=Agarivorans sp. TSD2052 TaxID=2937286 RepID=UPI002010267B|nr:ATP-binding protein [Agarivorans sp. TSD2052]UPW19954.1 ATP-binding protein [Agarivorans sp. TSD2052]
MTLTQKLSTAFIGITLFILAATLLLARWSFERGFLDYVNALEQQRLQSLSAELSDEYQKANNNWQAIPSRTIDHLIERSIEGASRELGQPSGHRRPPPPRSPDFNQAPPPPRMAVPTSLYDETGTLIAGPMLSDIAELTVVDIYVENSKVGELHSAPKRKFYSLQETAFSQHQARTSIIIGLICLAISVFVSAILARKLLAPVKRLLAGISELSKGNYSNPIGERRNDELGALIRDLDRLGLQLEHNRSARRRSLADISHELRTPVTVLTGEIEAIKDGIRPLCMAQLHSIDNEVSRLRRLIEDLYLLSLSDIGGLHYHFETLNLAEYVGQVAQQSARRANEQGLSLNMTCDAQPLINGDPVRIQQLLTNIVDNALAYTDSPGVINIALKQGPHEVLLSVKDSAPGLGDAPPEQLFEPLYRQDSSRSRRTAGAGLGLTICKNIVEAHQGSITAAPAELGGIAIEIRFPSL